MGWLTEYLRDKRAYKQRSAEREDDKKFQREMTETEQKNRLVQEEVRAKLARETEGQRDLNETFRAQEDEKLKIEAEKRAEKRKIEDETRASKRALEDAKALAAAQKEIQDKSISEEVQEAMGMFNTNPQYWNKIEAPNTPKRAKAFLETYATDVKEKFGRSNALATAKEVTPFAANAAKGFTPTPELNDAQALQALTDAELGTASNQWKSNNINQILGLGLEDQWNKVQSGRFTPLADKFVQANPNTGKSTLFAFPKADEFGRNQRVGNPNEIGSMQGSRLSPTGRPQISAEDAARLKGVMPSVAPVVTPTPVAPAQVPFRLPGVTTPFDQGMPQAPTVADKVNALMSQMSPEQKAAYVDRLREIYAGRAGYNVTSPFIGGEWTQFSSQPKVKAAISAIPPEEEENIANRALLAANLIPNYKEEYIGSSKLKRKVPAGFPKYQVRMGQ